jgi:hypothetical protein
VNATSGAVCRIARVGSPIDTCRQDLLAKHEHRAPAYLAVNPEGKG